MFPVGPTWKKAKGPRLRVFTRWNRNAKVLLVITKEGNIYMQVSSGCFLYGVSRASSCPWLAFTSSQLKKKLTCHGKCGMRGFSRQGRAEISSLWSWKAEMKLVCLLVCRQCPSKGEGSTSLKLIDRWCNYFMLEAVSGERTWQKNKGSQAEHLHATWNKDPHSQFGLQFTPKAKADGHLLETSQGYFGHSSLEDTAISSPTLALFIHSSFLACSQPFLPPPAIQSDNIPFAVGYRGTAGALTQGGGDTVKHLSMENSCRSKPFSYNL